MIVVIADDLTGAAEIGAVGLRYGLTAEVQTEFNPVSDADLIVIDTDTRSSAASEAAAMVECVVGQVLHSCPELLFKKVDSVLRGPVLSELAAIRRVTGSPRLLLVPANPSLGRVVRDGHYYVADVPIHLTDFAYDPEYPARSSDVIEMLRQDASVQVAVQSLQGPIPNAEIVVGEAESERDLADWALRVDSTTIPAGASGFFGSILESMGLRAVEPSMPDAPAAAETTLFVCGSASESSQSRISRAEARGVAVARMPRALFDLHADPRGFIGRWSEVAKRALVTKGEAVLTIGHKRSQAPGLPKVMSDYMSQAVRAILSDVHVDRLCIEGGSTASTLVRQMRWNRLTVCDERTPGVVEMLIAGETSPTIITKPGSYAWDGLISDE